MKRQILAGEVDLSNNEFILLSEKLAGQSNELESIIGMEMKQMQRLIGNREKLTA